MLFYVLIITYLVLIIYYKITKNSDYWQKRNVINEKGTLWNFFKGDCSLAEVYKKIYDKYPTEPCVGIYLGSQPALLIRDPRNIQAVLSSDFQSFSSRGIFTNPRDILADNILFMDNYPRWKLLRQKISPLFTSAKLRNMFYIIEKSARDFVNMMTEKPLMKEKPFNALYTYTTASIGASTFGINTHVDSMDSPFLDMAWKSVNPSFLTNLKFIVSAFSPTLFNLLNLKIFGEFEHFFVGVTKRVFESRSLYNEKRNDYIDLCLDLKQSGTMHDTTTGYKIEPTDEILAAQAFVFFLAGTDTSATVMNFTLLELSMNPDVLFKVHKEIDAVFKECNENITYKEIEKLTYLGQVINEAMRKYPPIGSLQRKCTKDTILPIGNFKVEKDVVVIVPLFALHRDINYFPKPDKFDPDRFSSEQVSNIDKFTYIPFGDGHQICLGLRFARLQVKAGLAWLLRKFSIQNQNPTVQRFEKSSFAIRSPDAHYVLYKKDHS